MAKCLFCGEQLLPGEVLFGIRKDDGYVAMGKDDGPFGAAPLYEQTNKSYEDEELPNDSQEEGPKANIELGAWVKDTPHNDFLSRFLYMDDAEVHKPQLIFAVKWSKDHCEHKIGRAGGMLSGGVPQYVELCDQDAAIAENDCLSTCFCPHCHCEIMEGFFDAGDENVHQIAFVGGSRAGKTQYLTALYQNLFELGSLANDYNLGTVEMDALSKSVMEHLSHMLSGNKDEDDSAGGALVEDDLGDLDLEGRMVATPIKKQILPVVMCITKKEQSGKLGKRTYIAIHDCPGEIFLPGGENRNAMISRKGLRNSDALLLMADAAQLFKALWSSAKNQKEIEQETCMQPLIEIIGQFCKYFRGNHYKAVSFVITKWDMVIDRQVCSLSRDNQQDGDVNFKKVLQSKDYKDHRGSVDMNTIVNVDNTLRALLGRGSNERDVLKTEDVVSIVESNLDGCEPGKLRFFCVSTYSRSNDDSQFQLCGIPSLERHRLLEPLLYLLAEFDAVDSSANSGDGPEPKFEFGRESESVPDPKSSHRWPWQKKR